MKRLSSLVVLVLMLSGCAGYQNVNPAKIDVSAYEAPAESSKFVQPDGEVKNIIFMIGDGMGINQLFLTRYITLGEDGRLNIERIPVSGLVTTFSASNLRTDSAAAATALATGMKTANGMIGQAADGTKYKTLLELAKENGKATGVVATKAVTDATPAGFTAHNPSRKNHAAIAVNMLETNPDIIMGGGRKHWDADLRKDGRDVIAEAVAAGYAYAYDLETFAAVQGGPVLGLFAEGSMDESAEEPSIQDMTDKSLEILSRDEDGFFVMIEGSQIDSYCHKHDEQEFVRRLLNFDMAVKSAIEFAAQNGNTLVIVTADHETGALMTLDNKQNPKIHWASFNHSSSPVAIYAYGPGSEMFMGMQDNVEVAAKLAALMGIAEFPQKLD